MSASSQDGSATMEPEKAVGTPGMGCWELLPGHASVCVCTCVRECGGVCNSVCTCVYGQLRCVVT